MKSQSGNINQALFFRYSKLRALPFFASLIS